MRPSRHIRKDRLNESCEPTSSIASTESRHGNSTGASRANDLGPGTLSPAAVHTLCGSLECSLANPPSHVPKSRYRRLSILEVLTKSSHCTRCTHPGAQQVDPRKLFMDLRPGPPDMRFPVLVIVSSISTRDLLSLFLYPVILVLVCV